jgi:hypothetical protein
MTFFMSEMESPGVLGTVLDLAETLWCERGS